MGRTNHAYHHYSAGAGGTLREAQVAKLDAMLAAAEVCAGDHVLEIGCGWGSMAIHAVQTTGCRWGARRAVFLETPKAHAGCAMQQAHCLHIAMSE